MTIVLSPREQVALTAISKVNATTFDNWFDKSSLMAYCDIESNFDPVAISSDGLGSVGLMQVLPATAAAYGIHPASTMRDPATSIIAGGHYAKFGWDYLKAKFGRIPTYVEWSAGYNEGYGAAARHIPDPAYSNKWLAAKAKWKYLDTLTPAPTPAPDSTSVISSSEE